jgi:putative salt-induced outer membrane protein
MPRRRLPALVLLTTLLAPPAAAQTPDSLRITADLGLVNASGNTDLTTVNAGEAVRWRRGPLTLAQTFSLVYGQSEGTTTSSQWRAGLRGEHTVSGGVSAYLALGFLHDRFAGIDQRFEEGAGIAFALLQRTRDHLTVETGLSAVQQTSIVGLQDHFASSRLALVYDHRFAEDAWFRQTAEALLNLEHASDYGFTTESALVAPLSSRIALKVTYVVRYDHQPEPGFGTTDRLLTSGLQLTL